MPIRETPWPAGTPCWLELMVPDVEAALKFYGPVIGWSFADASAATGDYRLCQVDGRSAAGIGSVDTPDQPIQWIIYFASENIEATLKLVNDNGGSVHVGPIDVADVCRIAIAQDSLGAVFGVFERGSSIGTAVSQVPGSLVWESGQFTDVAKARDFYAAVFGHTFGPIGEMDLDTYCAFQVEGQEVGGLGGRLGAPDGTPSSWTACIEVADVDTAVATAQELGGKLVAAAEDTPFGRMATIADPWGASSVVHGRNNDPSIPVMGQS
jgi:hypothetical protein